jgi:hypothetical protein
MRKIIQHTITCLALLMAGGALANGLSESVRYDVFVDIPATPPYVHPVDPDVFQREQSLQWDRKTNNFKPFETQFKAFNNSGGFQAKLSMPAFLQERSDPHAQINLTVTLNDTELNNMYLSIVGDANPEVQLGLKIKAQLPPPSGHIPGNYTGTVSLIFQSTPLD